MLPATFEYLKPSSLGETLALLEQLKGKKMHVLAGGTDLLPSLRAGVKQADYLVDLGHTGLNQIVWETGQVRIGALATFAALCHGEVQRRLPALAQAAAAVGAVQTRNLATIGGNLCEGVPSNDSAPALLALDAKFHLQSEGSDRLVPAAQFFLAPRRTVLQPGEIMTEILVPLREDFKAAFLRLGRRKALTLSIASAAAGIALGGKREVETVRIALGAVAPVPMRALRAEKVLEGKQVTAALLAEAAAAAAAEISPISDLRASADYRRRISAVLVRRVLQGALQQIPPEVCS